MSRKRGEFERRTCIFEGAYRAWSLLGHLHPSHETHTSPLDLLHSILDQTLPTTTTHNGTSDGVNSSSGNSDGGDGDVATTTAATTTRHKYRHEPLPRSGLSHKFIRQVLTEWQGEHTAPKDQQDDLAIFRNWWQHRRNGESKTALRDLGNEPMQIYVGDIMKKYFVLGFHFIFEDGHDPPKRLWNLMSKEVKLQRKHYNAGMKRKLNTMQGTSTCSISGGPTSDTTAINTTTAITTTTTDSITTENNAGADSQNLSDGKRRNLHSEMNNYETSCCKAKQNSTASTTSPPSPPSRPSIHTQTSCNIGNTDSTTKHSISLDQVLVPTIHSHSPTSNTTNTHQVVNNEISVLSFPKSVGSSCCQGNTNHMSPALVGDNNNTINSSLAPRRVSPLMTQLVDPTNRQYAALDVSSSDDDDDNDSSNNHDNTTTEDCKSPVIFISPNGDTQIALSILNGIKCKSCIGIIESALFPKQQQQQQHDNDNNDDNNNNNTTTLIDGLLDVIANQEYSSVILKITKSSNARSIASQAEQVLSSIGYDAKVKEMAVIDHGGLPIDLSVLCTAFDVVAATKEEDVLDWSLACTCHVVGDDCPRHGSQNSRLFEAFTKQEIQINGFVGGCGRRHGYGCSCGPKCKCIGCCVHDNNPTTDSIPTVKEQLETKAAMSSPPSVQSSVSTGCCGGGASSGTNRISPSRPSSILHGDDNDVEEKKSSSWPTSIQEQYFLQHQNNIYRGDQQQIPNKNVIVDLKDLQHYSPQHPPTTDLQMNHLSIIPSLLPVAQQSSVDYGQYGTIHNGIVMNDASTVDFQLQARLDFHKELLRQSKRFAPLVSFTGGGGGAVGG